jgi:transcriptional regulator of acetoin/glycerol metabolism
LKHCIDRVSALRSEGALLQMTDLPSPLQYHRNSSGLQQFSAAIEQPSSSPLPEFSLAPPSPVISLHDSERRSIVKALESTGGERAKTALLLGIGRTTLYRKMKQYGIE